MGASVFDFMCELFGVRGGGKGAKAFLLCVGVPWVLNG